jgi:hypothetical protein
MIAILFQTRRDGHAYRGNLRIGGCGQRDMLFEHGFGGHQAEWRFVAHAFSVDHRAHRPTPSTTGATSVFANPPAAVASIHHGT